MGPLIGGMYVISIDQFRFGQRRRFKIFIAIKMEFLDTKRVKKCFQTNIYFFSITKIIKMLRINNFIKKKLAMY